MTEFQMKTLNDFSEMLCKQIDKVNKKGDISPEELQRMDKAVDIIKDISVICAMEEYGYDTEEDAYSKTGMYGYSRDPYYMPPYYSRNAHRNSMGRYSRGYSRDDATHKMKIDLEDRLANAQDQSERDAIMKCLRALDG